MKNNYQITLEKGAYIGNCINLEASFVIEQVEKARKGNQKLINRIAYKKGIIPKEELKYRNFYTHLINEEYIIYD